MRKLWSHSRFKSQVSPHEVCFDGYHSIDDDDDEIKINV